MMESRFKNSIRNLSWGVVNKMVTLLLPFVTRTIVLYLLGAKFLGIGTLFSSVLNFLSLAELGLNSAIVYIMYKPIAENDYETISALLNYYRKLYRVIGTVILVIGTAILPFIPYLIKGDVPEGLNVYSVYYLFLLNSVISYFFAGYKQSLLTAYQRQDIITNIATLSNVALQVFQILLLYLTESYYVYAIVPIPITICVNILNAIITKRKFPEIKPCGMISQELKKNIHKRLSGLFGTKLNSIVVHSADTVVISAFLGLTLTAQYGNYYMLFNAVHGFVIVIYTSLAASIGNKLAVDSIEKNYHLFKHLSFLNAWIVCFCCTCFLCLYEPFMKIWVGEELCLGIIFVILFCLYFFVFDIQRTILVFKDAAGLWHIDKIRPYISMLVNLVSNLILVQFIGIYGIVVSSILSFLISVPWVNKVLFDHLFHKKPGKNLLSILIYFAATVLIGASTYAICSLCHDGFLGLVERLIVCVFCSNAFFVLLFIRSDSFKYWKKVLLDFVNRKLRKSHGN
ncbi:MAG: polysaccharide biosynthesis C-terminal domain-containing protein [Clostridia bacterium]|nr:polysaccharide biosynthesis C-terminal domain-containing protein [Clostridia bacterium]